MHRLIAHLRERIALRSQIVGLLRETRPSLVAGMLAFQVFAGLAPVAFILATSAVVGRVPAAVDQGVGSPEWQSLRNALLVAGGLFLIQQAVWPLQWAAGEALTWRIDDVVRDRVAAASFAPVGIAALEDQATLDDLSELADPHRGVGFSPGGACAGVFVLVARYVQWVVASVLIAVAYTWWAAVAVALGALVVRVGIRGGVAKLGAVEGGYAGARRTRDLYRTLLVSSSTAKEVRVFGLLPWLRDRYRTHALAAVHPVWKARRRIVYVPYLLSVPAWLLLSGAATIGVARAAAEGSVTLGELAFTLQGIVLVSTLGAFFHDADWAIEHGLRALASLERFEAAAASAPGDRDGAAADGLPRDEIRFEDVTFGYGSGERPVLRNLDLVIPAGRSLAIVGLNGAGKTTLVKLLARLHEPQSGRILVDGRDLREIEPASWRQRLGAIFQDFVHYDLSVRDNVGFGAPALLGDEARIRTSLSRAGGAALVEELPNGLDTLLSREYADGAELSGGQWQRVAIARALMAVEGGAGVLVLDEPTANLDVRAEVEFFERFLELTAGLTTILISHRFSTVRRADRIVVLEHGAVVEEGTHHELVAAGGRYASLFRLQAHRFTEPGA